MIDINDLVKQYLKSKTAITSVVGTRIYSVGEEGRLKELNKNCIYLAKLSSERNIDTTILEDASVLIKCYATTLADSFVLAKLVDDEIINDQMVSIGSHKIMSVYCRSGAVQEKDPVYDKFYLTRTIYNIITR